MRMLPEKQGWVGEMIAKKKDGSVFNAQLSVNIVFDAARNPLCMMGSFVDITERKQMENTLRKREHDLEVKSNNLEELTAALKVLLNERSADKKELEEKVLLNVRDLIMPYIEKIRKQFGGKELAYVNILESNLSEIISSFSRELSYRNVNLSPSEVRIANFIKQGKTNKEVATLLNVSARTVAFHRENIRKKLALTNKKVNLRTYLLSLQ